MSARSATFPYGHTYTNVSHKKFQVLGGDDVLDHRFSWSGALAPLLQSAIQLIRRQQTLCHTTIQSIVLLDHWIAVRVRLLIYFSCFIISFGWNFAMALISRIICIGQCQACLRWVLLPANLIDAGENHITFQDFLNAVMFQGQGS